MTPGIKAAPPPGRPSWRPRGPAEGCGCRAYSEPPELDNPSVAAGLGPWPRAQAAVQLAAAVSGSVLGAIPHCRGATSCASARLSTAARSVATSNPGLLGKRDLGPARLVGSDSTQPCQTPYRARIFMDPIDSNKRSAADPSRQHVHSRSALAGPVWHHSRAATPHDALGTASGARWVTQEAKVGSRS
jgi:hypothetical protein